MKSDPAEGVRQNSSSCSFPIFFVAIVYVVNIYYGNMNSKLTPESILQQIAQIQRLDQGTVSVIRQGPQGPYYNHQCYEKGRNVSRYVSAQQVPELEEAIEGYRRFQELVKQYVQIKVEKTRSEREAGFKKKTPRPKSSSPKNRKSNN
jgi:hypothetical protein